MKRKLLFVILFLILYYKTSTRRSSTNSSNQHNKTPLPDKNKNLPPVPTNPEQNNSQQNNGESNQNNSSQSNTTNEKITEIILTAIPLYTLNQQNNHEELAKQIKQSAINITQKTIKENKYNNIDKNELIKHMNESIKEALDNHNKQNDFSIATFSKKYEGIITKKLQEQQNQKINSEGK
jgi:hypothetical protein